MDTRLLNSDLPQGALDNMLDNAVSLLTTNAKRKGLKGEVELIRKAGYSDDQIWETVLRSQLKPGMEVDVTDPCLNDSPHSNSFTGNVLALFPNYVRVVDMEDNAFDLEFEEIAKFGN